jgi:hypothetical protein
VTVDPQRLRIAWLVFGALKSRYNFNRHSKGVKCALSDDANEVAPLFTAVQLVRLRDRMKGSNGLDYSEWLEPMQGPELGVRQLAANPVSVRRRPDAGRKAEERDSILRSLAFFERDFALWRDIFLDETDAVAKFLALLANLQLNVSPELEELKSLNQRNENALLRMEEFTKTLRAAAAGEKAGGFDSNSSIYRELLGIAGALQELKARVDEKAEDAVRLISLMTPSVDSQTLIDLLTGDV